MVSPIMNGQYIEFGKIPELTAQALHLVSPDDDSIIPGMRRAVAQMDHERALELAEQQGLVRPRNPVSLVLDSFSFGEHSKKRLVPIDQVQAFAASLGIQLQSEEQTTAEPTRIKKKALIQKYLRQWESAETDLNEGSRNDLRKASLGGGFYDEDKAVAWAKARGKFREPDGLPTMGGLPGTVHRSK